MTCVLGRTDDAAYAGSMRYVSTRGRTPFAGFDEVLTRALAPDGGLFVPEAWPPRRDWNASADAPFAQIAAEVLNLFTGDAVPRDEAAEICEAAFATFRHPEVAPLRELGEDRVLELHHGPTLAFKDVAMQLIARLFERSLGQSGRRMTVVVATSGDTGGAAVSALAGRENLRVVVLHPHERISEVQRRFMTTSGADNVLNLAVEGTFDDCQRIVKALFADRAFADEVALGGVNSINWARIAAQVTYYITACQKLPGEREVHFSVPTGNFGDVFAGWVAKRMGAPVGKLIIAVNENDILDRALKTGTYQKAGIRQTTSPSMDIEIASNFERQIFEASGRDAALTREMMDDLSRKGGFILPADVREAICRDYLSQRADEDQVAAVLKRVALSHDELVDPHTAIGLHAADRCRHEGLRGQIVTLSTAHPAKFPEAVEAATGRKPGLPFDPGELFGADESFQVVAADEDAVKKAIRSA